MNDHQGSSSEVKALIQQIVYLTRLIEQNPKDENALWARGDTYRKMGDFSAALEDYNQAILLNPNQVQVLNNRGVVHRRLGHFDEAIADFTLALAIDPSLVLTWENRSVAYLGKKLIDQALADINQAIKLDPQRPSLYYNRALIISDLNQLDQAITDYTTAIRLNPQHPFAHSNRGSIYKHKGETAKALFDFEIAIQLNPRDDVAYYQRAHIWLLQEDYKLAVADFSQAIALNPNIPLLYCGRGESYAGLQSWEQALTDFNQAIALDPNFYKGYAGRGLVHRQLGNAVAALADFKKASKLNPQNLTTALNLASLYKEEDLLTHAHREFTKIIRLKPDHAPAYYERGCLSHKFGHIASAIADFQHFLKLQPHGPERSQVEAWIAELTAVQSHYRPNHPNKNILINGRYRIIAEIGRDRFCATYRVENIGLSINQTLKIMDNRWDKGVDLGQLLKWEAVILTSLEHPLIPTAHDFGLYQEMPYLVTYDFAEGSLHQRLKKAASLSPMEIIRLGHRIGQTLDFIHQKAIIHRAINSHNIWFNHKGKAMLTNFMFAYKPTHPQAYLAPDELLGSFDLAPERWQGWPPSPTTDNYQFALLIFELLTGQRPFSGTTFEECRQQHLHQPVPAAKILNRSFSPECNAIFQKALAKEPSQRYETAVAFMAALEAQLRA